MHGTFGGVAAGEAAGGPAPIDAAAFLAAILRVVPSASAARGCAWGGLSLSSHFQPIIGVERQCVAGHEGLIRARDGAGRQLPPAMLFARAGDHAERLHLDWLARALHLRSVRVLGDTAGLLFMNVAPDAASRDPQFGDAFAALIARYGGRPENIVVEITENAATDESRLVEAAQLYRAAGCRVAIDDFGAGAADVRRVWRLRPDIVKLDRSVLLGATRDAHARRVLKNLVNMLHDSGAQVVLEGIEAHGEAQIALETGADYLQGYYFGRPGSECQPDDTARNLLGGLLAHADLAGDPAATARWHRHAEALTATAMAIETGEPFSAAVHLLHRLPGTVRCYLLAADGRMLGASIDPPVPAGAIHASACDSGHRVGWQIRRAATGAVNNPGVVRHTMPYASPCSSDAAGHGVTLCCGFGPAAQPAALCVDIAF